MSQHPQWVEAARHRQAPRSQPELRGPCDFDRRAVGSHQPGSESDPVTGTCGWDQHVDDYRCWTKMHRGRLEGWWEGAAGISWESSWWYGCRSRIDQSSSSSSSFGVDAAKRTVGVGGPQKWHLIDERDLLFLILWYDVTVSTTDPFVFDQVRCNLPLFIISLQHCSIVDWMKASLYCIEFFEGCRPKYLPEKREKGDQSKSRGEQGYLPWWDGWLHFDHRL